MAISFAESRLTPLVETDPAWKPFGLFTPLPPAMEMLEDRDGCEWPLLGGQCLSVWTPRCDFGQFPPVPDVFGLFRHCA
eukprot:1759416-Alexandrium_andersonii.AAC.1